MSGEQHKNIKFILFTPSEPRSLARGRGCGFTDTLGPNKNAAFLSEQAGITCTSSFRWLFSNAEVFEDDIQDLLWVNPSCDPAQAGESQPDTLGCQSQVNIAVPLVLNQGCSTLLQVGPVAGLGQGGGTRQRVTTPGELDNKKT